MYVKKSKKNIFIYLLLYVCVRVTGGILSFFTQMVIKDSYLQNSSNSKHRLNEDFRDCCKIRSLCMMHDSYVLITGASVSVAEGQNQSCQWNKLNIS